MYLATYNTYNYNTAEEARDNDDLFASGVDTPKGFTPEDYDLVASAVSQTLLCLGRDDDLVEVVICKGIFGGNDILSPVIGSDWYEGDQTTAEMDYVKKEKEAGL